MPVKAEARLAVDPPAGRRRGARGPVGEGARQGAAERDAQLVEEPERLPLARGGDGVGVGGGEDAGAPQHRRVDLVERVGAGVVELVRPLDDHRAGDADGRVGEEVVVAAAREGGHGPLEEGVAGVAGQVGGVLPRQLAHDRGKQVAREARAGRGRPLGQQRSLAERLVLADHVEVDRGDGPRDAPLVGRQVAVGAGDLRRQEDADAAAGPGQRAVVDQAAERARALESGGRAAGVVVGRGLRVAEVRDDQHLLASASLAGLALAGPARDEGRDDLHLAVVEARVDPGVGGHRLAG